MHTERVQCALRAGNIAPLANLTTAQPPVDPEATAIGNIDRERAATIMNWLSLTVPIRRPWHVFEDDLEDHLSAAKEKGLKLATGVREVLVAVRSRGAWSTFLRLPEVLQRTYAEVSLNELSAYVSWRAHGDETTTVDMSLDCDDQTTSEWDALSHEDKVEWVPDDPRASLAALGACWAPLLADGPPPCGSLSISRLPVAKRVRLRCKCRVAEPGAVPAEVKEREEAEEPEENGQRNGEFCLGCGIEKPSPIALHKVESKWQAGLCFVCRHYARRMKHSEATALDSLRWRAGFELNRAKALIPSAYSSAHYTCRIKRCLKSWKIGAGRGKTLNGAKEVAIAFQFVRTQNRIKQEPSLDELSEAMLDTMALLGWGSAHGKRKQIHGGR